MGDIQKWCPMCGAAPGEPCKVVSGTGEEGDQPGDARSYVHWARFDDEPRAVLIPNEPPYEDTEPGEGEQARSPETGETRGGEQQ